MLILLLPILIAFLVVWGILYYQNEVFKKTTYYKLTGHSFRQTVYNLGTYGEYLTYKSLRHYEDKGGKFLFNCYLPKDDGATTEIDVILINEDGVFCFESKNYSGWIFGDEKAKYWTQTLPKGKGRAHKERFLNPILQNKGHIKWLKKQIDESIPVHSVIVFSQRCTLKKVTINSPQIHVINRPMIAKTVSDIGKQQLEKLASETINDLYNRLYPYTHVTDAVKAQHIEHIKKKTVQSSSLAMSDVERINSADELTKETIVVEKEKIQLKDGERCPQCGSELVLRTAKRGEHIGKQFYGCTAYPKCRFTRPL